MDINCTDWNINTILLEAETLISFIGLKVEFYDSLELMDHRHLIA